MHAFMFVSSVEKYVNGNTVNTKTSACNSNPITVILMYVSNVACISYYFDILFFSSLMS